MYRLRHYSEMSVLRIILHRFSLATSVPGYHLMCYCLTTDVLLQCLDTNWELHCPLLVKSKTLSGLLQTAGQPSPKKYYKTPVSRTLDEFISSSNIYSTEYRVGNHLTLSLVYQSPFCSVSLCIHLSLSASIPLSLRLFLSEYQVEKSLTVSLLLFLSL